MEVIVLLIRKSKWKVYSYIVKEMIIGQILINYKTSRLYGKHPECSLCVHATYLVSANKEKMEEYVRPNYGNKVFTVEEVIEGGWAFCNQLNALSSNFEKK